MALWQFTFRIVPKKVFMSSRGEIPGVVSYDDFRDLPVWDLSSNQNQLFQLIDPFFPRDESQSTDAVYWGTPDTTDFSLSYDDKRLVDFTVRLDLRSLTKETLELIERIGKILNAVIVTEQCTVIEPVVRDILAEIRTSKAFKFISDPKIFLDINKSSE